MNALQQHLQKLQKRDAVMQEMGIHRVAQVKTLQKVRCKRCGANHKILTAMTPPFPLERCQNCMTLSDRELRNRGK